MKLTKPIMGLVENAQTPDEFPAAEIIGLANELADRYEISSTRALIKSITALAEDEALDILSSGGSKPAKVVS